MGCFCLIVSVHAFGRSRKWGNYCAAHLIYEDAITSHWTVKMLLVIPVPRSGQKPKRDTVPLVFK